MSSTQSINESVIKQLTAMEAACAAIRKTLGLATLTAPSAPAPAKGRKAKPEASGEPKEKKEGSSWAKFSAGRVGALIRAAEAETPKEQKTRVDVVLQFASALKSKKAYDEWTDEDIMAEWDSFEPPAVSKKELERQSKASTGSAAEAEPVADEEGAGAAAKKARKPMSEEAKAAKAAKAAATKAAKKAAAAAAPPPAEAEEAEEETPADSPPVAAEEAPAPAPKAKKAFAPKPSKKKEVDLALDPWSHDGTEYLKNERGDVLTVDGEWVGLWDGKAINRDAPEPADFEVLTTR